MGLIIKREDKCPYSDSRLDCFGRRSNNGLEVTDYCHALKKTNFKGHECPFYKSYEDFKEGQKIYGGLRVYVE